MLISLNKIFSLPKTVTKPEELTDAYWKALRLCSKAQITTAVEKYMNTETFWPKPAHLRQLMPEVGKETNEKFIIQYGRCLCGYSGLVIEEPKGSNVKRCRECYNGISNNEYQQRMQDLSRMMSDKAYRPQWVEELEEKQGM